MSEPTYFAVITPPGRGAVATIAVRGPKAIEIVGRRFDPAAGKPLAEFPVGRVVFGRFHSERGAGEEGEAEELVVGLIGSDEVEVHCHGGSAAVESVARALLAEGGQRVTADAWAWLTADNAIAAEATLALAAAPTERTASILLDQVRGALRLALAAIDADLECENDSAVHEKLLSLLQFAHLGQHLTRPWKVVIAGRPNVGKSSLANALLGYQRSIVFDQPGTTRDVLTATTAFDGWPVELVDTAGLRAGADAIEAEGVERAQREIAAADAVLFVADCTLPWTQADEQLSKIAQRTIIVHNKCDLAPPPSDGRPPGIAVSARSSLGLDDLTRALVASLVPRSPQPGAAVPCSERQVRLLGEALAALARGERLAAQRLASEIAHPRHCLAPVTTRYAPATTRYAQ